MLGAAVAGGIGGERFHRTVDEAGAEYETTPERDAVASGEAPEANSG